MKSFKISIAISVLLIIGAFFYQYALNSVATRLNGQIIAINNLANLDDWQNVNQKVSLLDRDFDDINNWLSTLVNHYEIDSITQSITKLTQYGIYKDKTQFMAELYTLKRLINHLPLKEKLNIKNFL